MALAQMFAIKKSTYQDVAKELKKLWSANMHLFYFAEQTNLSFASCHHITIKFVKLTMQQWVDQAFFLGKKKKKIKTQT